MSAGALHPLVRALLVLLLAFSALLDGAAAQQVDYCGDELPMTVQYRNLPPLFKRDEGGMFQNVLTRIVDRCCARRQRELLYLPGSDTTAGMYRRLSQFTFNMPVSLTFPEMTHLRVISIAKFLPLLPSPGVLIIGKDDTSHPMIEVIFQAWPLLLLILCMTLTAGVIIWFFDHGKNSEQFPKKFLTGWVEGVWWAFVSMTTVGYGDIAPRSIAGRIFGVIWILIGICIISIFTSIVTAALTSESTSEFNLRGHTTGVLRQGDDQFTALSNGATPITIADMESIEELIENGTIDVALIEPFIAVNHLHNFTESGLSVLGRLPQDRTYGILLWNVSDDLYNCFSENVLFDRQEFSSLTDEVVEQMGIVQKEGDKSIELMSEIFDTYGYIPIYITIGIFVLIFIIFLIVEFAYRRPRARKKKQRKKPQLEAFLYDETLQELQMRQNRERANLEAELKDYQESWNDKLKLQVLKHKCERDEYAKRNMPTLIHTLNKEEERK